jgi:diguanylate cyclase (GGDEF)-like protein
MDLVMFNLMIALITLLFFAAFLAIFLFNRHLKAAAWVAATFFFGILGQLVHSNAAALKLLHIDRLAEVSFLMGCICLVMGYAARGQTKPNTKLMGAVFCVAVALISATEIMPLRAIIMDWAGAVLMFCGCSVLYSQRCKYIGNLLLWFNIISVGIMVLRPLIIIADIYPAAWPNSYIFYLGALYLSSCLVTIIGANIVFVALGSDLIEQHQKAAMVDPLTGLLNRRGMAEIFREMDYDADKTRHIGRAMLMFDIDHFKQVNDEYGHEAGDTVLINIGATVAQLTKQHGQAARTGGEEFMFLFNAESTPAAFLVAEHLRVAISLLKHEGLPTDKRVTASFGLVFIRENEAAKRFVRRADMAMYAAKDAGRNRLRLADGDSLPEVDETLELPRVRVA